MNEQPFVRPDVARYLQALHDSGAPPPNALSVADARAMIVALREMADADAVPLAVVRDLQFDGPAGRVAARLYDRRPSREASPLILFFHGGGFVFGDLYTHEPFCTWLAAEIDLPVLAVDYRRAPEHRFPAAHDDCEAAARWVATSPATLGLTVSGLICCGDSAGGNLALATARALDAMPAAVPLRAQWAIYPYVGGNRLASEDAFAEGYMLTRAAMDWFDALHAAPADDPRFNAMLGAIPAQVPLVVQTASLDPLRDQGRAYAARASAAGVPVEHLEAEGMIHGFLCLRKALPSAQADLDAFLGAAKRSLG